MLAIGSLRRLSGLLGLHIQIDLSLSLAISAISEKAYRARKETLSTLTPTLNGELTRQCYKSDRSPTLNPQILHAISPKNEVGSFLVPESPVTRSVFSLVNEIFFLGKGKESSVKRPILPSQAGSLKISQVQVSWLKADCSGRETKKAKLRCIRE